MPNERTRIRRLSEKKGLIKTHIENNFRNYIIVSVIFLVRSRSTECYL